MRSIEPHPRAPQPLVLTKDAGTEATRAGLSSGQLVRVRVGAYAVPDPDDLPRWEVAERRMMRHAGAVLAKLQGEPVLSHVTAALVHGLWIETTDRTTHVTQTWCPDANEVQGVRRHVLDLPAGDITVVAGMRVTTLERTVEDCARWLSPPAALALADSALRMMARPDRRDREASQARIDAGRNRLRDRLERLRGYSGVVRARAVLEFVDGWAESPGESKVRWVALAHGLPAPVCQFPVHVDGREYSLDLGWDLGKHLTTGTSVAHRILGEEYDGVEKYLLDPDFGRRHPLVDEKLRERALASVGVDLRRRIAEDLTDHARLASEMAERFPVRWRLAFAPRRALLPRRFRRRGFA